MKKEAKQEQYVSSLSILWGTNLEAKIVQISWQFHIFKKKEINWNYSVKTGGVGSIKTAIECSDTVNKEVKGKIKTGKWNRIPWQSL